MSYLLIGIVILVIIGVVAKLQRRGTSSHSSPAPRRSVQPLKAAAQPDRIQQYGLPVLGTLEELAAWLQISPRDLTWLMGRWTPKGTGLSPHYVLQRIPKSGGGERVLLAPKSRLKAIQRRILREMLDKLPLHDAAHGFRAKRSILTNATPHVGQETVACFDLTDFFPSITYPRVCGLFHAMGYSREIAGALAALCSTRLPGTRRRVLPQGAPTSPAISNLIARHLDVRLAGLAQTLGFRYTRYADDCTLSGPAQRLGRLIRTVRAIVRSERFTLHEGKLRVHRRGACQQVTGLVVNTAPTITRAERRRLRAILHQAQYSGLEAQNRNGHAHFAEVLRGKIAFLHMINPRHAAPLQQAFNSVCETPSTPHATIMPPTLPTVNVPAMADSIGAYTPGPETLSPRE